MIGLAFLVWAAGLYQFIAMIPVPGPVHEEQTDAIVVLTGGAGRVQAGLDLLQKQRARKLFVSGVYRGVDVREILRVARLAPEDLQCCIVLGYVASSTRGNAEETAAWIRQEGYVSFTLVTASYHMPRALKELDRVIPADIRIVPYPVFPEGFHGGGWRQWPEALRILLLEFSKYLVAVFVWT